jgi:8-oxo-dGTP pyrophosphatase MutT (NUDIX family)
MIFIPQLREAVEGFNARGDERCRSSRKRTLALLEAGESALDRTNYSPGHITASGVVLSADRSVVLLVFHNRLGRWLQPGGHVEAEDADTAETAAREVAEETGVPLLVDELPVLIGVDVHDIPGSAKEPPHLHYDLVWRFFARGAGSSSEHVKWCPVGQLASYGADAPLERAVQRALDMA